LLADRVAIVQALFDTFAEYEPNPDDLEAVTTGKTTEQGIKLRLASQRVSLFFGATGCKFTKEAAVWAEADKILGILSSFLNILTKMGEARLGKRNAVLSLHLQPKTVSFQDVLRPFITPEIQKLDPGPLAAMAVVARWPGRRITLDGSAQLANGIFVQMERDFPAELTFDEMKQQLFDDEIAVFQLLRVEEVEE